MREGLIGLVLSALLISGCASAELVDRSGSDGLRETPAGDELDRGSADPAGEIPIDANAEPLIEADGPLDSQLDSPVDSCLDEEFRTADPTIVFTVAHRVVDGALGARCFGDAEPTLVATFDDLATFAPPGQLQELTLFAGYRRGPADGVAETLAFVNGVGLEDGTEFQMSVSLDVAEADPDEMLLTLAHEITHVFTLVPSEIDRTTGPDECTTWWDGEGCFLEDSLMWRWITTFWTEWLDDIDPDAEPFPSDGDDRCAADPGFLGAYAATRPDEDFAEAFSAWVLRVDVDHPERKERLDWFEQFPGLIEFRDRADAAGLGPLPNTFERCG